MPLYDYQCAACNHRCELLEKMSDPHATVCPSCQADQLKRQVSAPQFQLKGSGWYVTDFKAGAKNSANEKAKATTEKPEETTVKPEETPTPAKNIDESK